MDSGRSSRRDSALRRRKAGSRTRGRSTSSRPSGSRKVGWETLNTLADHRNRPMVEEPIIRGIDAHKIYNSGAVTVHALRGVNLAIPKGEMVAIMGPSGCGKTTLLNCFSGLDDLSSGDVRIEGVSLQGMDDDAKSRYRSRRMGFVFQSYNLLPVLTAAENVELPLLVAKAPAKEARRKAVALLGQVELDGWEGHKPAQLSAGQQQRVAIARALANVPGPDRPRGAARRHRGHLVEPGRRRHLELHLPRGRLRPARRDRRNRVERVQRPADLLLRGQRDPGCRGPRGLADADRRPRADAPKGHARPQRRGQQGESTDHRDGTRRVAGGRLRAPDGPRRFRPHHGFPERFRRLRERTGGGGSERDRRSAAHVALRDHEPAPRPLDGGR